MRGKPLKWKAALNIFELYISGMNVNEISKVEKISISTIYNILNAVADVIHDKVDGNIEYTETLPNIRKQKQEYLVKVAALRELVTPQSLSRNWTQPLTLRKHTESVKPEPVSFWDRVKAWLFGEPLKA